jgi:hypothetical protein
MPRAVLGECGCMSSPWVGLSLAGWQFTQRGCMITFAASVKSARERACVSRMPEKAEGLRNSSGFCAETAAEPTSKSRTAPNRGANASMQPPVQCRTITELWMAAPRLPSPLRA